VMSSRAPLVGIVMGSKSDWDAMRQADEILTRFDVPHESGVMSAHRTPALTTEYASQAAGRGLEVIIAGAGGAAHLAGVLAAHTVIPVIGVPMQSALNGLDSLLSTVRCPEVYRWRRWRSARPGRRMPGCWLSQFSPTRAPNCARSSSRIATRSPLRSGTRRFPDYHFLSYFELFRDGRFLLVRWRQLPLECRYVSFTDSPDRGGRCRLCVAHRSRFDAAAGDRAVPGS
jgi:hypothetical protein